MQKVQEMLSVVQTQLAIELNCAVQDLTGAKDTMVFTCAKENPGRRPFPRNEQHFEMLTMGNAIVVTASPEILDIVKPQLAGKSRDEAFSMPFVYGHALSYLPDLSLPCALPPCDGFAYTLLEQAEIPRLYQQNGFERALQYDANHARPDVLAITAEQNGTLAAAAGASRDCDSMWQIGIDVLPQYRGHGLASFLVRRLTDEILRRGIVPYYCTSPSNISSQRAAHRAGYFPAWLCSYQGRFAGYELLPVN